MPGVSFERPLWVTFLLFLWNWIIHKVKKSCEFPLSCSQNLDGYFCMNNKVLLGGHVGVHRG